MKRVPLIAAAAALLVGTTTAIAASTATAQSPARPFSLRVIEHDSEGTITPVDFGQSLAPNQQATEDAPAYQDGVKVGLVETVITVVRVTDTDAVAMIECSVELPHGNIFFNGTMHLADLATGAHLPVLGGTGQYIGARGAVTVVGAADGSSTRLTFRLLNR